MLCVKIIIYVLYKGGETSLKVTIDFGNVWEVLSTIGTVAAVIVSLYLARRDAITKIKMTMERTYLIGFDDKTEYFTISCVNVGRPEVSIT